MAGAGYDVATVTVHGIDASCVGDDFGVTLVDVSGANLGERRQTDTIAADFGGSGNARSLTFDFSASGVPADDVRTLAVVFADGD